ncbi:hypothetical protein BH09MYX1_BH09MYX1_41790 [soil metagenome]
MSFLLLATLTLAVGMLSIEHLPMHPRDGWVPIFPRQPWLDALIRWDAGWYCTIAEKGYDFVDAENKRPTHFFPLYPLLMHLLSRPFGGGRATAVAGAVVAFASGLVSTLLFVRIAERHLPPPSVRAAVGVLLTYPFAFFLFGTVYADALFLALALGSFLLVEQDRPVAAGLVGALATATRPIGPALIVGLVVLVIERRRGARNLKWRDAGVLLSALGLGGYCLYLWLHFGSPLHFIETAADWDAAPGPRTRFKVRAFEQLLDPKWTALTLLHFASAAWCFAILPAVRRTLGTGYAVYALLAVGIAFVGTADIIGGMGRYTLAGFPCFLVAGHLLAKRRWRHVVYAAGAVGCAVLFSFFARWYFVS